MKSSRSFLLRGVLILATLLLSVNGAAFGAPGDPPEAVDEEQASAAVSADIPYGWRFEQADSSLSFQDLTGRYMRLDSLGKAHVVFGGDHLYYAVSDGGNWTMTTVDPSYGVGRYASLVLDSNDRPHISYFDALNGALKYAYFDGSTWSIQVIDGKSAYLSRGDSAAAMVATESLDLNMEIAIPGTEELSPEVIPGDPLTAGIYPEAYFPGIDSPQAITATGVGQFTSIALDGNGDPGISYYDIAGGNLKYAFRKNGVWTIQLVDRGESQNYDVGTYTSLAFNTLNRPGISYADESNDHLKYAYFNGSNWVSRTVDDDAGVGAFSSLIFDVSNQPHISYYDGAAHDLRHAWGMDSGWVVRVVDASSADVGAYSSIALDARNHPWVSYYDATNGSLKLATWDDKNDKLVPTNNVLNGGRRGLYSSLAVHNNDLGIAFYNEADSTLQYVFKPDGGAWQNPTTIAKQNLVGISTSLDVASDGTMYVSYMDDTTDQLLVAVRSGGVWSVARGVFPQGTGLYSSLKVDNADHVHLAYYDQANGDLRYAFFNGSSWSQEVIASNNNVGLYVSLVVDSTNTPHVAFFDKTNQDLMYAKKMGGVWQVSTIAGDGDETGEFPSIAVDGNDIPSIAVYNKGTTGHANRLDYAVYNPSGNNWSFHAVAIGSGMYPSLFVEPNGTAYIAYYYRNVESDGDVFGSLRFARGSGDSWVGTIIDSGTVVGLWPSLQYVNGEIHISYYDETRTNLKYANWNASQGWTTRTIDDFGEVGMYSSLWVGSSNEPVISYFDKTNGDLKVAFATLLELSSYLPLVRR